MNNQVKVTRLRNVRLIGAVAGLMTVTLALAGCGESTLPSTSSSTTSGGATYTASQVNNYFGTANSFTVTPAGQTINFSAGGIWDITLDSNTKYFSYSNVQALDYNSYLGDYPLNGSFTPAGPFDRLTFSLPFLSESAGAAGYAVTLANEGVLLRPGNSQSGLVSATASNTCPAFTKPETFNFVSLGTVQAADITPHVAYGSIQIAQGSGGLWNLTNDQMYYLGGAALTAPTLPSGTCPSTQEGSVISIPIPAGSTANNLNSNVTVGVSPSGLLTIDQGQGNPNAVSAPTGPLGLIGILQPAAALTTTDLTGKTYAGFESDALSKLGTVAVAFTHGSGTAITGGGYPNDDATMTAAQDTTLDLGTQDTKTPGLYPAVTLTRPDTFGQCGGHPYGGTDGAGDSICIFQGAAIAGQVAGKYVIYTNINDASNGVAVINLVLYQQ